MERVCNETEFEVEGWRKIPPLMKILEDNLKSDVVSRMKLKTIPTEAIFNDDVFKAAIDACDPGELSVRTIKDSWIYKHFVNQKSKPETERIPIAAYVNVILPINERLNKQVVDLANVGKHCVVIKGLTTPWRQYPNIECLELETNDTCKATKYIPVNHPFFEEVQIKIKKLENYDGSYDREELNKYGKELAVMKWGKVEDSRTKPWYGVKILPKNSQAGNIDEEKLPHKYDMIFIRGRSKAFQLEFTKPSN